MPEREDGEERPGLKLPGGNDVPARFQDENDPELQEILGLVEELGRQLSEANEARRLLAEELAESRRERDTGAEQAGPGPAPGAAGSTPTSSRALGTAEEIIVALLVRFREHCTAGNGERELFPTLNLLVKHADAHFTSEQARMDKISHPARHIHRREHEQFLESMFLFNARLKERGERSGRRVPEEFLSFLTDWVKSHIEVREDPDAPLAQRKEPSKRALVVDDSLAMRKLLVRYLAGVGLRDVDEAANGEEALSLAVDGLYQVVLLDWIMPGLSGLDVLRALRARGNNVPVVMVTTEGQKSNLLEAIHAGANYFVVKPVSEKSLLSAVHKVMQGAS